MAEQLKKDSKLLWYRIDSILGRGGFGITYLATDTNLETQVAIKEYLPGEIAERKQDSYVIPKTGTDGEMYRWGLTRFIEEARILAKFKHQNIVRVHSVFEENNTAYMVMEYEHGNNLDLMLRTPQYQTEERLVELFDAILSGLEQVHAHDIIHRDIKPANIYIREDGSPVLLDFGSARQHVAGKSQNMTRILTKGYAPYEQMDDTGAARQGPWTDIYAIGATLYYAISRKLPTDCLSRFTRVIQKQPDPLTPATELETQGNYSPEFLFAIDQALQFDSADRPQSVHEFRDLLRAGIDKMPHGEPAAESPTILDPDATILATPSSPAMNAVYQPEREHTRFSQELSAKHQAKAEIQPLKPSVPAPSASTTSGSPNKMLLIGGGALLTAVLLGGGFLFLSGSPDSTQSDTLSEAEIIKLEQLVARRKKLEAEENKQREAEQAAAEKERQQAELQEQKAQELAKQQADEEKRRLEDERIAAEQQRLAAEKLAAEKKQAELKKAKAEQDRIEAEKQIAAEQQRLEQERLAAEKIRLEEERLAEERELKRLAEKKEAQRAAELRRLENQRLEAEKQQKELEQQRQLAEQKRLEEQEQLKQEQVRLEELKRIEKEEKERLAKLEAEEKAAAQKAEAERLKKERAAAAKLAADRKKAEAAKAKVKKQTVAKKANISPAVLKENKKQETESDMQSISRLFNEFRISLASCDTKALSSNTRGQKSSIGFVQSLCNEYSNMDISIRNFQSNVRRGVASADVTIQKLTSKSGDTVLPSKSWNTLPIKTLKSDDGFWEFVEW